MQVLNNRMFETRDANSKRLESEETAEGEVADKTFGFQLPEDEPGQVKGGGDGDVDKSGDEVGGHEQGGDDGDADTDDKSEDTVEDKVEVVVGTAIGQPWARRSASCSEPWEARW